MTLITETVRINDVGKRFTVITKKFGIDFEDVNLEGYRNINELYKQHNQLHACETLFGDWDAEVMILAQDAANFNTLKKMAENSIGNPFRHSPENKTNCNLYKVMKSLNLYDLGPYEIPNNKKCGLYYANAIWLAFPQFSRQILLSKSEWEKCKCKKLNTQLSLKKRPFAKLSTEATLSSM